MSMNRLYVVLSVVFFTNTSFRTFLSIELPFIGSESPIPPNIPVPAPVVPAVNTAEAIKNATRILLLQVRSFNNYIIFTYLQIIFTSATGPHMSCF